LKKHIWKVIWKHCSDIQKIFTGCDVRRTFWPKGFVAWFEHGTELKIFGLAMLWQVEWTAHCSNIGCLVHHTNPAWTLLDIRNSAITQMFRDQQNQLSYCHVTFMVEVAKPILMANAVHQGLQGSYFSIRYLFFQNPMRWYTLSYRVNFILNAMLMNSMK